MLRTTTIAAATAVALTGAPAAQAADVFETTANQSSAFAVVTLLIKRAGIEDELNGEGPITLFAPTDQAFAKLPDDVMASLLDPANREMLRAILTNHVVEGMHPAGEFIDTTAQLTTLAGNTLAIEGDGELLLREPAAPYVTTEGDMTAVEYAILEASVPKVTISDAGGGRVPGGTDGGDASGAVVILPDITADNGVIHAVSEVLVPAGALTN
ncbi:fasciclin domain-containing protein [Acuticoccus sp.]|uniref:fasciclin domain-containing protein n=1 Tax=Acuticoccus sp. TaxID=1904378 RepID=UPI003B52B349